MSRDSWATPMAVYMAMDSEFDFCGDMCADDGNAKHPVYITEADDALAPATIERVVSLIPSGNYVWINPPYSNTTPWVALAIQLQERGIGSVMLAMDDSSVGWYWDALQRCNEIREVVKGRIAFVNSETGLPVSGNNKGSKFLMFDPYGRQTPPRRTYIERDQLMLEGGELMQRPDLLFPQSPEQVPLSPELEPVSSEPNATVIDDGSNEQEPEPQTEFSPDELRQLYINGELGVIDWPRFLSILVVMFEGSAYNRSAVDFVLSVTNFSKTTMKEKAITQHQYNCVMTATAAINRMYGAPAPAEQVAVIKQAIKDVAQRAEPEPKTEFTLDELHHLFINGELRSSNWPNFIACLVVMFWSWPTYNSRQVRAALVAEAADNSVKIEGLTERQRELITVIGESLEFFDITDTEQQAAAITAVLTAEKLTVEQGDGGLGNRKARSILREFKPQTEASV